MQHDLLTIYMNIQICKSFSKFLLGNCKTTDVNHSIYDILESLETVIRYHYHGGSNYDTKFWRKAKSAATEQLKNDSKFYKHVTMYRDLVKKQTPDSGPQMLFDAVSWHKLDKDFEYNYYTSDEGFQFDKDTIDNERWADQYLNTT